MSFDLKVIDWTAISAMSTLFISLLAIFLPILRDRPNLKLKAMLGEILPEGIYSGTHLVLTIQNHGTRPATVIKWYARVKKGEKKYALLIPIAPQLPNTIFPGQSIELLHQEIVQRIERDEVVSLYIEDSLDHVYKLKGERVRR